MLAIYIHGKRFCDDIFTHKKLLETRCNTLLDSCIGETVLIIQSGLGRSVIRGKATITGRFYTSASEFQRFYNLHRVKPGSKYYTSEKGKYCYWIMNAIEFSDPLPFTRTSYNRTIQNINMEGV